MSSLVTPRELAAALAAGETVRVLDVRWRLDAPDGRPAYRAGHIPGAVYVDLEHDLAAHDAPATEGRHPLPDVESLQEAARRWGVRDGETVVVYDDLGGMSAARAWWLLSHAGVETRVLDGALAAWIADGLPLEEGEAEVDAGDVRLAYGSRRVLSIDEAARFPETGALLDARAGERYRGDVEPIDPRAGHIPGALSVPTAGNLDADGRFLSAVALRARFADAGVDLGGDVAVYCGSGVTAAHQVLALGELGVDAALFPGSWSAWANTERDAAVGPTP